MGSRTRSLLALAALAALTAPNAAQSTYGAGTPGTGGIVPRIGCNQAWLGNTGFAFEVDQVLGAAPGFLLLSSGPSASSLGTIPIWVDLVTHFHTLPFFASGASGVPGAGAATLPYPLNVPVNLAWVGGSVYAQAVVADFPGPDPTVTGGLDIAITLAPELALGTAVNVPDDPIFRIDPATQSIAWQEGSGDTDGSYGLAYVDGGKYLYQTSYASNALRRLDLTGATPTWMGVASFSVSPIGLRYDHGRGRLWTLAGASSSARELVAFDVDDTSPTLHMQLASTSGLTATLGLAEIWTLSPDGTRAAISQVLGDTILIVDVDPGSPGYMQTVSTTTLPTSVSSPIHLITDLAFSADGTQLLALIQHAGQTPSEIARHHLATGAWIDHDSLTPAVDNLGPMSQPPLALQEAGVRLMVPPGGNQMLVVGFPGWAGRVDIGQLGWSFTPIAIPFGETWEAALDPVGGVLAITDDAPAVHLVDVDTLTHLGTVAMPPGTKNLFQLAWR